MFKLDKQRKRNREIKGWVLFLDLISNKDILKNKCDHNDKINVWQRRILKGFMTRLCKNEMWDDMLSGNKN